MRIKYVISTMVFWWREHNLSLEQECEYLKSLGFGIELWATRKGDNECRYIKRNWTRLQEATRGMSVCLSSRHDGPTLEEWLEQIQCAQMLSAPIVANLQSLCVSDKLGIADWNFTSEVVKMAEDNGVMLCVETGSLPAILEVGDRFDSVRFCLDSGFAYLDPKNNFQTYVDKLAPKTTYLHLTDNYGQIDDHEPPGVRGGMKKKNWTYLLEGLQKYDNDVIGAFEMFPSMPGTMVRQGCKFLFDVVKWPDKPKPKPGHDETSYRPF